jgi:hypothetical protein
MLPIMSTFNDGPWHGPWPIGLVTAAAAWLTVLTGPVISEEPVAHVTTDTPEYCLQLLDRVSAMVNVASAPPPSEVTSLSTEGQRMCDHGQLRGGIARLRRALLLLQHPGG